MHGRRRWLVGAIGATTTAALTLPRTRTAAAATWGAWPSSLTGLQLPPERRAKRVLELFVFGGLCPWDTFYCVPGWGQGQGRFLHAFDVASRFEPCGGSGALTRPFALDDEGTEVHLGPWTHPLWSRPDLLARMRVVVTRHDQLPHETALPLSLTGSRLGSPQLAGTGSAVQRHFSTASGGAPEQGGPRVAPYAYVVRSGGESPGGQNTRAATATGRHPVAAHPWDLSIDQGPVLARVLERSATTDDRPTHDALLRLHTERYAERLRGADSGRVGRSAALDAWPSMLSAMSSAPQMAERLGPSLFGLPSRSECGELPRASATTTSLRAAASLLRGEQAARYVLCVDAGLRASLGGGHDTHRDHLELASLNYVHALRALAEQINAPGEADPDKLDLHDTLVVITSEFGRSPHRQASLDGLNHWPHGYVSVLMGGPIDEAAAGVAGSIDPDSGVARRYVNPAELRAGLLDALGIYPFDAAAFGLGDLQGAPRDDATAIAGLRRMLLGDGA